MKRMLVFHRAIAPYRVRFFNRLYDRFGCRIVLSYRNLQSQKFDYDRIESQLHFNAEYIEKQIKIGNRYFYLGTMKKIRDYEPDMVIVNEFGEALWGAILARATSKKKYSIITLCDDSLDYARYCKGLRKISRNRAMRHLDGIIFCNEAVDQWYKQHFSVDTYVFPILQDENDFNDNATHVIERANGIANQYQLEGKRVYLFVGRLSPEKNIEYLIRSFIRQHSENPENVLFIVGGQSENDPTFSERMNALLEDTGSTDYIWLVGRKEGDELKAWYTVGEIFVLPSRNEAFGAVVNEALLSGEYVMVSDRAGSACLVNDGNGELIDIDKPYIDFKRANTRVAPIQGRIESRKSLMAVTFENEMNGLIHWLERKMP